MAQLLFFDADHTYTVDGETVPSVSELTRFLSRELYGDIQQYNLDRAASRGTAVHKATEVLDKYGKVEASEDIVPYVKAYLQFLKDHKPTWEKIEWAVCSPEKDYAGTIDRYGIVDEKHTIVDLKTTANICPRHRKLYEAAQNLYRMAIEHKHPVEQLLILQLKNDGTYKLYELPVDSTLANACLAMHKAMAKKKRRKKVDPENGRDDS